MTLQFVDLTVSSSHEKLVVWTGSCNMIQFSAPPLVGRSKRYSGHSLQTCYLECGSHFFSRKDFWKKKSTAIPLHQRKINVTLSWKNLGSPYQWTCMNRLMSDRPPCPSLLRTVVLFILSLCNLRGFTFYQKTSR